MKLVIIATVAAVVLSLGLAQDSWAGPRALDCPSFYTKIDAGLYVTELDVDFLMESWEECGKSVVTVFISSCYPEIHS